MDCWDSLLLPRLLPKQAGAMIVCTDFTTDRENKGRARDKWQVVPLLMRTRMHHRTIIEANLSISVFYYQMAVTLSEMPALRE